ncbi:hypothetical protein HDV06_001906 [Boothiomyces sp. JEL0866]|nr:hypothetical protein HDV06_001906 [Boothiomyces sp. JEL0866]
MLVSALVLAIATVSATPVQQPVTLKLSKQSKLGLEKLVASTKSSINRFSTNENSEPLENVQNVFYQANVTVGNGQVLTVDLDTGSSDVWFRGSTCTSTDGSCDGAKVDITDSTLKSTGKTFSTTYGSGSVSGNIYTGSVGVAGAVANNLPFGVSTQEKGFSGVADGLLGLGFNSISQISQTMGSPANWFDALGYTGSQNQFSFYLSAAADGDSGEITIGGVDTTKYSGSISWVPLNSETYWQFDVSQMTYKAGTKSGNVGSWFRNNAISDTGTTLIIMNNAQADAINMGIGAKPFNSTAGIYYIDCGLAKTGAPIQFSFPSFTMSIPPAYYVLDNGDGTCISGVTRGAGFLTPTIFGDILTRAYYTVYDKANNRVGFAKAVHPH